MSSRNRFQNKGNNFDLDQYIKEKSGEETFAPYQDPDTKKNERSKWIRSTMVLIGAALIALLFLNESSLSGIFSNSEDQVSEVEVATTDLGDAISEEVNRALEAELGQSINNQLQLDGLTEEINRAINEELNQSINQQINANEISREINEAFRDADINGSIEEAFREAGLYSSSTESFAEGLEALTESSVQLALESVFQSLESLEGLEGLEGLEALEGLEVLEGLEALEALENLNLDNNLYGSNVIDLSEFEPNTLGFGRYNNQLTENNIDSFDSDEIRALHSANVPIAFLTSLRDSELLSNLNVEQIISLYEMRGN